MEVKELEKYIEHQIEKIEHENEKYNVTISEFETIKNFIYNQNGFNDITDIIMQVNSSNVLNGFKDSIINTLNDIKILKDLLNEIENNLSDIDISIFEWNLNNREQLFNDINSLKELYVFAINPNFEDQELKDSVFALKNKILSKINFEIDKNLTLLKRGIESVEIRNINKARLNLKDNDMHLANLKLYLDICTNNKRVQTEEQIKMFLEFIKNSTLPKDVIYKLIIDFSKNNIAYYNNILRRKLARNKSIIKKNKEAVHEKIRQLVEEELPKVQVEDKSEDLSQILTPEEKNIYDKVRKLLDGYAYDDTFFEIFENNFSLDDRLSCYGSIESISWDSIKSDFVYILEPNLSGDNKSKIFSIFNYILELNEKNIQYKENIRLEEEKKDMAFKKISVLCEEVKKILKRHKNDLDYLAEDEQRINLCDEVYALSKTDIESAELIASGVNKSIESFQIQYILKELTDYIELINIKDLSLEEIDEVYKTLNKLLEEYQLIFSKIYKKPDFPPKVQTGAYDGENFVCFMTDNIDFENKGIKSELKAAIKKVRNTKWYKIMADGNLYSDLTHKTPSGREEIYSNDIYSVGRIWATGDYRTGFVVIRKMCDENKEKIMKRYNLEKVGVIAFVIGVIHVKADHSGYKELTDFMNSPENQNSINYYVELFMNKDTPEEKLFEILDKGIIDCNKVNNEQVGVGGNVYA